ncbi:MAG: dihydrolipoyl dehydrogenase [Candidatus Tectomicrobia bacterium]|uniref:Dihydrolipoyl dehydrogenase n=1 Tax=Tectimicrobiota bacterium TaxID=2528274 RepID=A0A938B695_UNCTE|nr:dihydrolipoyl dehydrogenase [Candidatus Tectomicrobia bacterium]
MPGVSQATQLAIIGGGPGGYAAAFLAADLGMQVTLIDQEPHPGGVCLYRGCIPSKALLHVANVLTEARQAARWGVTFTAPTIDLAKLRAWKDEVVQKLTSGLGDLCKRRQVHFIQGQARFQDATTLHIDTVQGETQLLTFAHAIIATGSRPATLPHLALESPRLLDSTTALALPDIPPTLLVIGGGYIGLELGSAYAALGAQVSIVEMTSGLLPGVDRDLVNHLSTHLKPALTALMLNTTVTALREEPHGLGVTFQGPDVAPAYQVFDRVLIAVGRRPNTHNLGLEHTRITLDQHGFIPVDAQRCTAEPGIYAIGDVTGEPLLAHKASHEGRVAVRAMHGEPVAFTPHAIPAVVFTDPEIAWCGLTETQARQNGRTVDVARFPWAASGRATTLDRYDGVTKLLLDPATHRILGVGIAGPGAGELIAEGVLAVEMAAVASDLALSIHPHPTLSETLMEAAEVFFGQSTHVYRPLRRRSEAKAHEPLA